MKANTENFSLILIFIFLVTLSYFQANSQSFGYQVDQDWTILYNSLLLTSNIEQYFISHPAYTTFFIFSICLKVINFFSQNLNINVLSLLDGANPAENLQNIFIYLRIINSILIFLIFLFIFKTLKSFNIPTFYNIFILLFFLFFDSVYHSLFFLRSEALSVLLFLVSNYFIIKYLKKNFEKRYIILSSIFFTLAILAKTQVVLLFLSSPFIFFFLKHRLINQQIKNNIIEKKYNKYLYFFIFFVILFSCIFYIKYPAGTDLLFFTSYLGIYLIFHQFLEKISLQRLREIIGFMSIFIFGIIFTLLILLSLDFLNIVPFNTMTIPLTFARPITNMSMFTGSYNLSENNLFLILVNIINHFSSYTEIKQLLIKNKFIIIFIPLLYYYIIKKTYDKNFKYLFILFGNFIILSSIFLFFRDSSFYQIYFIPVTLFIFIELSNLDKKKLFLVCIFFFIILNFNSVKAKILEGLIGDKMTINVCGFARIPWDAFYAHKTNYDEFQLKICPNN